MKNNTTDYETKINELQEEQEQLRQDINILWELYKNIQDEEIQATAAIISLASLLVTLIIALIIGLKITGGI